MRISLWRQFSSNHSGFYWVVGVFKTVEEAQKAYEEIRAMLFAIDRWHREHRDESHSIRFSGNAALMPSETEFSEKFHTPWPSTIDWTNWANYDLEGHPMYPNVNAQKSAENLIDKAVRIVGRNVVADSPDQTWMTIQPFAGILEHFGAQTIGYDFEMAESGALKDFEFHSRLTFVAPDASTGDRVEEAIRKYLSGPLASADNLPPWHEDEDNLRRVLPTSKLLKIEYISLLKQKWQYSFNLHNALGPSPYGLEMPGNRLALRYEQLQVKRNGLNFTLDELWFHNQELGISAMIAWLEVNNCTEIDFRYLRNLSDEGKG